MQPQVTLTAPSTKNGIRQARRSNNIAMLMKQRWIVRITKARREALSTALFYAADAAKNTVTDAMEILYGRGNDNGVFSLYESPD
ncbi:hypothetical protein FOTG_06853 [Fusarium oxysporum f. sp. vasinfectum 25433]|uniref:Uncharacterized protein n=1 Tax=Fusarium oxysporum f. sp. vasinfectum 25433 TaxID=1089449 RepID=X0N1P8_FUSOX|nr:hypothetical protein FOTG_06853 [Fusarium oxysporum f. sp. vasinfectum 25433]